MTRTICASWGIPPRLRRGLGLRLQGPTAADFPQCARAEHRWKERIMLAKLAPIVDSASVEDLRREVALAFANAATDASRGIVA